MINGVSQTGLLATWFNDQVELAQVTNDNVIHNMHVANMAHIQRRDRWILVAGDLSVKHHCTASLVFYYLSRDSLFP